MSRKEEEKIQSPEPEEAAATALTSLGATAKPDDEEDDGAFDIPQRLTKSGRKRAVPFPIKVRRLISTARR